MGNSSSTPSSSTTTTTTNGEQYDVFISFRGEDTRNGFTSHLYKALDEKQIRTFIDNQLVRGEEISAGLLSVIRESKISVVIFSENYASSKWCLRELEEIMKCKRVNMQIVIPVFYKVDPSHVRKQIGSYEAALAKHELQQEDEVKKWREALTEASNISGFHSSNARDESKLVCNIVKDVWNKLYNISPSHDFKGLVGIDKHIERVVSLLSLGVPDFRIIGIWGMGGMGKTTIVDAVFQLVSHQFENRTHFARCVGAQSETYLFCLRDKILSKVLNIKNLELDSPSIPQWIVEMLNITKVLIVLDDVNKLEILEILVKGIDRFGPGSRIILTTRDKQVLRNCGVEDHNIYEVKGLNHDEALQLFCNYAFKQNHPTKHFEVISREVVKIATNVPLAVKVLGSLLYTKSKRDCENAKDKFQRNVNPQVFDVLKISYDGLDDEEKCLFLDIACFLVFPRVVDCEPNLLTDRELSLSVLIDKSLVTVANGWIEMHDLLQNMGSEIASEDHSRVWRPEDVIRTLKHNDGTDAVQAILLNGGFNFKDVYLSFQALTKMDNLRTLVIYDGELHVCNDALDYLSDEWDYTFEVLPSGLHFRNDGLDSLSSKLRYLHWFKYPLEVLPSRFNPENLVELDLSCSKIKQLWERSTRVPKLKRLSLVYCANLISIPDLSNIPSAEIINLEHCSSLIEIHSSSRECPKKLHSLNLTFCTNLSSFPSNIHLSEEPSFSKYVVLHSSREGSEFSFYGCDSLTKFPDISGNIKSLDLSWSGVEKVPSTIQSLSKLVILNMSYCTRLKSISKSICKLKSLDRLSLKDCCKLKSFPDILEGMELKYLDLSRTAIKELPPSIGNLNRLEVLDLSDCKNLETFPSSISNLELEGNVFERLPKSIKKLSKLYHLSISRCGMLRSLPELPSSLRYLDARDCKQLIQSLPDGFKFELCPDGSGSLCFNFLNCLKLNQKAVSNLLIFFRDSLRKMQDMGTEKIISLFKVSHEVNSHLPPNLRLLQTGHEVKGSICLPGSEIPEWFSKRLIGSSINSGSSINIPVLRNDYGRSRYIMGFEICLVIGIKGYNDDLKNAFLSEIDVQYDFHIETSDGHKERFFRNSIQLSCMTDWGSDHILLEYNLSRKCYEFFQELDTRLANRGMSDYVGTSFEFNIPVRGTPFLPLPRCEVKYCGIRPIYVKAQVMNFVSINQDTGNTSGCNDTAEETCEPHPKRICTEANQCLTTHGL